MAAFARLKKVGNYIKRTAQSELNPDKLQKAVLCRLKKDGKRETQIPVQFNPNEYSITRHMKYSIKRSVGKDEKSVKMQVVTSEQPVLHLILYFDSYSDLSSMQLKNIRHPKTLVKKVGTMFLPNVHSEVNDCVQEILDLIAFAPEEHGPPKVEFLWGETDFIGRVFSNSVHYTMFDRSGVPVRAKLSMALVGMDVASEISSASKPPESPDRTKQRLMVEGDQLWMVAQQEFGDPGMWKIIARENGILNPRMLEGAMRLKVPSL